MSKKKKNEVTYEKSPELIEYEEYIETKRWKELNRDFVRNKVGLETFTQTVDWLFYNATHGVIESLAPYLQRILLTHLWEVNDHYKAKSYIRTIWTGTGKLTPLCLISPTLILENIEEKIKITDDVDIVKQLNIVKAALEKIVKRGVKLVNLDGQTRTYCGVLPYLKSKFNLKLGSKNTPIPVENGEEREVDITIHDIKNLPIISVGYFLSQDLLFNRITKGTLDQVSEALIAINSNVKWTPWQELLHGGYVSVFGARIYNVIKVNGGRVADFLKTSIVQTPYKEETSGWEHFVGEQLFWLKHHAEPTIKLLEKVFKADMTAPDVKHTKQLKGYILDFAKCFKNVKPKGKIKHLWLSTLFNLRDVLDNYSNRDKPYYNEFGVTPNIDILNVIEFHKWYYKKMMNLYSKVKVGTNELNDTSWILDKNGEYLPVKDAMPSLLEQGSNYSATVGRVKLLIEELNNDLDYLSNERIISINVHKPSLIDVVVSSNYETNDGKKINPLTDMDGLEKGHIESDAHGGDKSIENITAQEFESNRDYGTMDLIEK